MSAIHRKPRRLERHRKVHKAPRVAEQQGTGSTNARIAKAVSLKAALQQKKKSNKLVKEIESLSVAELHTKLAEVQRELFNLRFMHTTNQLENVAALPTAKRQIARILTLIKQKEVGA